MSNCGGLVVAALALPLILTVLLVAGVAYLAIEGAKLVGQLAYRGIQLAGQGVATLVREASTTFAHVGEAVSSAASSAAQWTSAMFDSSSVRERLTSAVTTTYQNISSQMIHADSSPLLMSEAPRTVASSSVYASIST
jgi:hypothetical protein